ncbi:MAG: hypothetical protein ACW96X_10810 [Promethearchaeota archaeon]|jgi:hypothetical protein
MEEERKDYYEVAEVQEKSREDLDSYKELLKRELESIRTLVGTETIETNAIQASTLSSNNIISPKEHEKLLEENRTLKYENESLTSTNAMLLNDSQLLRENIKTLKMQNSNITELENEIASLKEVILNLEKEKLELKVKETVEIPEMKELSNHELPVDISDEIKSIFGNDESSEASTSQVHKGYTVPPIKPKKFRRKSTSVPETKSVEKLETPFNDDSTSSSELDSEKINEETVRRKCPTCFNTNKKFIRELDDKSNILMQYPRIYGKMYKCGLCTTTWR